MMTIDVNIDSFADLPVESVDLDATKRLDVAVAYRIEVTYDEHEQGVSFADKLDQVLSLPGSSELAALVIGDWGGAYETSSSVVTDALCAHAARLPALRALFLGEMTFEECEISWIKQSNLERLWMAFANLTHVRVRGGSELSLGRLSLPRLRHLAIETGGLDRSLIQQICAANLPELEHLELWLGTDEYGGNVRVDDLSPMLEGALFPKLRYLGLRNSEFADELAPVLAQCAIVRRLETLDLSLGNLTDKGAEALLNLPKDTGLRRLDIHHHYLCEQMIGLLGSMGFDLNADDPQQPDEVGDDTYCYIAVSE